VLIILALIGAVIQQVNEKFKEEILRIQIEDHIDEKKRMAVNLASSIDCIESLAGIGKSKSSGCEPNTRIPVVRMFGSQSYATSDPGSQFVMGSGGNAEWVVQATCGTNDLKVFAARATGTTNSYTLVPHPTKGALAIDAPENQISDTQNPMVSICPYLFVADGVPPTRVLTTTNAVMQSQLNVRSTSESIESRLAVGDIVGNPIATCDGKLGSAYYWLDYPPQASPDGKLFECTGSAGVPAPSHGWSFGCRKHRATFVEGVSYELNPILAWPGADPANPPAPLSMAATGKTPESPMGQWYGMVNQDDICSGLCRVNGNYRFSKFLSCNPSANFKPTTVVFDRQDSEISCYCAL
jgi:hypothetical protein